MIRCKFINTSSPLHLSKDTDKRYLVTTTSFYLQKSKENNDEFEAVFRLDPIIHSSRDYGDIIIWKFHTPGISPTPGLLSLEYDMIEDFLRDWEILGIYDIFEHPDQLNPKKSKKLDFGDEQKSIIDIDYKEVNSNTSSSLPGSTTPIGKIDWSSLSSLKDPFRNFGDINNRGEDL